MDVFDSFPNAIITDDWSLGSITISTDVGKIFKDDGFKSVIVDEGAEGDLGAPNADTLTTDTLIYAKPDEMPTTNPAEFVASYFWYQKSTDQYYRIMEVGVGKNQDNGIVEHIEFRVRPNDIALEDTSDGD